MAPQLENGYAQLANEIIEDLAQSDLTGAQFRLVLAVHRRTFGECEREVDGSIKRDQEGNPVKKKWAEISTVQFMELTKLSRVTVIEGLADLVARNILQTIPGSGRRPSKWAYQKYAENWLPKAPVAVHPGIPQSTVAVYTGRPQRDIAVDTGIPQGNSGKHGYTEKEAVAVYPGRPPINKSLNKGVYITPEQGKTEEREPPSLDELRARYSQEQLEVVDKYWTLIRRTRATGKLAESVIRKWMDKWVEFPTEKVVEGMQIHLDRYQGKREEYTHGIIRRLKQEQGKGVQPRYATNQRPAEANAGFDRSKFLYIHYREPTDTE